MSGKEHVLRIDVTWIYEYGSTHDQTNQFANQALRRLEDPKLF